MHVAAHLTTAEFLHLDAPPPGVRFELLDGELVTMNAPANRHQFVALRLAATLDAWCQERPGHGRVGARFATDAGRNTVLIPDLQWFAPDRELPPIDAQPWPVGDLVGEVLSPTTARYDRLTKLARYLEAGAREVWLVDPVALTVEIHEHRGTQRLLAPDATLTSPLLPGFALPLARLRVD